MLIRYGLSLCLVAPVAGQTLVHTFTADTKLDRFGEIVRSAGDANRDGYADVLVAASGAQLSSPGYVRIYSGIDGRILHTFRGDAAWHHLGTATDGIGDVNGDGHDDIVATSTVPNVPDYARAYSGKDGKVLHEWKRDFLVAAAGLGDLDGDGRPDVAIARVGTVYVFSGGTGKELFTLNDGRKNFGYIIDGPGDVDRDGAADIAVGYRYGNYEYGMTVYSGKTRRPLHVFQRVVEFRGAGDVNRDGYPDLVAQTYPLPLKVVVFSGKDKAVLYSWLGLGPRDGWGWSVSGAGDVNGDGHADVVASAMHQPFCPGSGFYVRTFSGKDGKVMFTLTDSSVQRFGHSVSGGGDVDGDGFADILIGDLDPNTPPFGRSKAFVFSGKRHMLSTDVKTISVTRGGTQTFTMRADWPHAGKLHFVLGSASGTKPGLRLGSIVVPLNPVDFWFILTATNPNVFIQQSFGVLDARGNGKAWLTVPPGLLGLRGLRFHHAFVVIEPRLSTFDLASNAVPLTFTQ